MMPADMDKRQCPVDLVIERHRQAFAALERHAEIVDRVDEDSDEWTSGQLDLSRLEGEVHKAAVAMTTVPLPSIAEVVSLLAYVEEFSSGRRGGYLLWPDAVPVDDREMPWSFAVLSNIRICLA
jgi:hypothetical protein